MDPNHVIETQMQITGPNFTRQHRVNSAHNTRQARQAIRPTQCICGIHFMIQPATELDNSVDPAQCVEYSCIM